MGIIKRWKRGEMGRHGKGEGEHDTLVTPQQLGVLCLMSDGASHLHRIACIFFGFIHGKGAGIFGSGFRTGLLDINFFLVITTIRVSSRQQFSSRNQRNVSVFGEAVTHVYL